jgi:hypothetical protein
MGKYDVPEMPQEAAPKSHQQKSETPENVMRQNVRKNLDKLEHSEIGLQIKELLDKWIKDHLEKDIQEAYADKINEKGLASVKTEEFIEIMADSYLRQYPDEGKEFKSGNINMEQLTEGMFDIAFNYGLSIDKKSTEQLLQRFKDVIRTAE